MFAQLQERQAVGNRRGWALGGQLGGCEVLNMEHGDHKVFGPKRGWFRTGCRKSTCRFSYSTTPRRDPQMHVPKAQSPSWSHKKSLGSKFGFVSFLEHSLGFSMFFHLILGFGSWLVPGLPLQRHSPACLSEAADSSLGIRQSRSGLRTPHEASICSRNLLYFPLLVLKGNYRY